MPEKTLRLLVEGGKSTAGPPIGSSLGPLGVNVMQVVEKINEATAEYKGMRVPVEVTVDTDTKEFSVKVGTPSTAALIVKEAGAEKGSGTPGHDFVGSISMESVVKIAAAKQEDMRAKTLKAAVKQVLGTCVSMGVLVDNKNPKEVIKEVEQGKYDELLSRP
ncbi:MAG: 50S ribosomal protein L11 [Aigarchaeota archaeon]|nr:50S ribosomal protein L11 [Candidatus Pelearchaeum maunauluense]